ncbi:MAG: hypothetical protein K2Q01_11730 [Rickettsiales bacterium]|nr:hypothetical protein [Rickettsiales bacterium]
MNELHKHTPQPVSKAALQKYSKETVAGNTFHFGGLNSTTDTLLNIIHGFKRVVRRLEFTGSINNELQIDSNDRGVIEAVSTDFLTAATSIERHLEGPLETDAPPPPVPNKQDLAKGFSPLYHLIKPTTESGRYARALIEQVFDTRELGKIPDRTPERVPQNAR